MKNEAMMKELPYLCPDHPEAQILHEWDREITTFKLTGAQLKRDRRHQYFCNVCKRELCSEEEYRRRQNDEG